MTWKPLPTSLRILAAVFSLAGLGMAWRLTWLGATGAEDIPPPFTLVAGLGGLTCLAIAIAGRLPRPD